MARRVLNTGGMQDRTFWHSDPEALLVGAAQALEAKRGLAQRIGRPWTYVDEHLALVLLHVLRDVPDRDERRRREDRRLIEWVSRLVAEIPDDDPYRTQVLRRLRQAL